MINFIKRILGIQRLEILLEKDLEELSQDDVKVSDRVRRLEKDVRDLLVYLKVERKEEWVASKNALDLPKLVQSKWVKKK